MSNGGVNEIRVHEQQGKVGRAALVKATLNGRALAAKTTAEIDAELSRLAADQALVTDAAVAGLLEQRREALEGQRRIAHAVEQAEARRVAVERAAEARAGFEQLEASAVVSIIEAARALDRWVDEGARLVRVYREAVAQVTVVHRLALVPALPMREFDLAAQRERVLDVETRLLECLARARVLDQAVSPDARDSARTVAAFAASQLQRFLTMVRDRLPGEDAPPMATTRTMDAGPRWTVPPPHVVPAAGPDDRHDAETNHG